MPTKTDEVLTPEMLQKWRRDGFVLVENFLSAATVATLREACSRIVKELDPSKHPVTSFTTTKDSAQFRSAYFLESGDDVCFFFEEDAVDEKGALKVAKEVSLNKIGHALHWLVPEFKEVSFSAKLKTVATELGFVSPALVQSMYIFKQPGYGGEVTPHKDSTFLSTEPQSCVGLWFALEDADEENGCLWFSPGSHNTPTKRRFVRVVDEDGNMTTKFTAPPDTDNPDSYVITPVKAGTMVIIHGSVDHKSARNTSSRSRHAYTFHLIERHNTVWDPNNWQQPTANMPFTGLFEN